jgi:oligogalacturonide lyase
VFKVFLHAPVGHVNPETIMTAHKICGVALGLSLVAFGCSTPASRPHAAAPPTEWIDRDTGHRVVRLSREPGSQSLYFHQNGFTPDGQRLVFGTPTGIAAVNLQTRVLEKIVTGRVRLFMVGRQTGQIYYTSNRTVFAVDPATKATRELFRLPPGGMVSTVNANETRLAGTITERTNTVSDVPYSWMDARPRGKGSRAVNIEARFEQRLPMELFFFNLQTGELKKYNRGHDWLNHLQFSPTDPNLLMFCHEGPWHKVDRTWTIRADGTELTQIHRRTMTMEIAGHEFWSADGKTIWYDLQTPRGEDFWLAGCAVTTGERIWHHLQRDEWSVHYNVSPDGTLFAGDGGSEGNVAHAKNGKWIYLFRPERLPNRMDATQTNLITPGVFKAERLVNLSRHNYELEPNVNFTPDGKWIVFRSNMHGEWHVYAVEVTRAKK